MAADPYWLDDWIRRNGPYLYHSTQHPDQIESILRSGLLPWDHPDNPHGSAHGGGQLKPRPGHVYLKPFTLDRQKDSTLRVDIRNLDPNLLNPDEDNMVGPTPWNLPGRAVVKKKNAWGDTIDAYEPGGDWANRLNLSEPSQTAYSLENPYNNGVPTIAYNGVIPPEHLEHYQGPRIAPPSVPRVTHWIDDEPHELAFQRIWNKRNA